MTDKQEASDKPLMRDDAVAWIPDGYRLDERKADEECGCPEESWDTPFGYLNMHLAAGRASNAYLDDGEQEREVELTAATVDDARSVFFAWAMLARALATPTPEPEKGAAGDEERRVLVGKALASHIDSSWDDYEWEHMPRHVRDLFLEQADLAIAALSATSAGQANAAPPSGEAVAELVAMLDAASSEEGSTIFDHTPEEIGLHVMENHREIRAALASPSISEEADRAELRSAIAAVTPRPILKALHSRDGRGDFSTATFIKLQAAGLCDGSLCWTDKGLTLRAALGISDT